MLIFPCSQNGGIAAAYVVAKANHAQHVLDAWIAGFGVSAIHDVFDGEFQRTGVGEEKLVVVFLHFQHTGDKKIGMDYHVRHGFSHGFMDRGVVYAFHSFEFEGTFQVCREFRHDAGEEVEEIVLPCSVVGEAVAPTAVAY